MQKIVWQNKVLKISDLKPAEYNPRKLTADQKQQIKNSLDKFSLAEPIVVNSDMTVIGGHQRIKILKESGVKEIEARVPSELLPKDLEKELNIRLNKNSGEFDFDILKDNFEDNVLLDFGFSEFEIGTDYRDPLIDSSFYTDEALEKVKDATEKTKEICKLCKQPIKHPTNS